ncbi:uncharacterized protein LOC130728071 [Lotus japonicus]|uniref:uncharacterized protein LOC130728071 n=1 Tax=Lotus japonicus TaxID=34305 RepID=UPI0025881180|nr:uncharacterized protein LOC130728071 [Lotus japonicus]
MVRTTNLFVLLLLLSLSCLVTPSSPQHPPDHVASARLLDSHLQDFAFKALSTPRTGVPYDAEIPTNLTGMKVSTMRLRSGSLRTRGVSSFKEFEIPQGVVEMPYVQRLVLVYHNLGNWSEIFYPLPGYSYLAPVIGLLAYSGVNLSASGLPELDLRASEKPILVKFYDVKSAPFGSLAKCVYFDLHGSMQFETLLHGNVCSAVQQGHFSIVVESNAPSPSPGALSPSSGDGGGGKIGRKKFKWKIVVPCLVGGIVLLGLLIYKVRRARQDAKIRKMELTAERNESLIMASIGDSKAPIALWTRTSPVIENDYVP